jgi:hypothetical protein
MIILKSQLLKIKIKDLVPQLGIKIGNLLQVIPSTGHKFRQLNKNQIKKLIFQRKKS